MGDSKSRDEKWLKGSGNVFADLGFANAAELAIETELLRRIIAIIRERKLSQRAAARVLGVDQPKVCALMNGKTRGYSIARRIFSGRILRAQQFQAETIRGGGV